MGAMPFRRLYLLCLFMYKLSLEVAADVQESSDGPGAREPVWLTDVQAAMEFVAAAEVTVIGFFQDLEVPAVSLFHSVVKHFQDVSFGISTASEVLAHYSVTGNTISLFRLVDNKQLDLKSEDIESMDATKLSHFIQRNNLHLVTEYNPTTVIGLFNSMIPIHLLLMMNKASPEYEESLHRYQEAAKLFQGKWCEEKWEGDIIFQTKGASAACIGNLPDSGRCVGYTAHNGSLSRARAKLL
ncbi:endoplasmic reticulum resident protein 27 isoform X7 [Lagenorhynchus albirostris]|uniref:endoplasmic reticulum resident protein 27 isoform X7 n=1 Tax=Lagenorhynchus albirostris TaxID=27610 RepID=UPI0028F16320|nr:endoplasmic reticulum resident protein 27 isoform X7 [Lagenorhynchus albirostris]